MSKLCGKWPTVRRVPLAQLGLEVGAERAGQHLDDARHGVDATTPCSAVRSSTTPPNTGTDAPHTPLRPPAAVTGTPCRCAAAQHRGDLLGRRRPAHGAGTLRHLPASAQCIASGHQSRLASAVRVVRRDRSRRSSRSRAIERVVGLARRRRRGATALPVELDRRRRLASPIDPEQVRPRWSSPGRVCSMRAASRGTRRPGARSRRRPSRARRRSAGDIVGGGDRCASRSNSRARVRRDSTSSSVTAISSRRVDGLGLRGTAGPAQRLAEAVGDEQRRRPRRRRAVAVGEMGARRLGGLAVPIGAEEPQPLRGRHCWRDAQHLAAPRRRCPRPSRGRSSACRR